MNKEELLSCINQALSLEKVTNEICIEHLKALSLGTDLEENILKKIRGKVLDVIASNDRHIKEINSLFIQVLEEEGDDY